MPSPVKSLTLGISGASGLPYAMRLLECCLNAGVEVSLVVSKAAQVVNVLEMNAAAGSDFVSMIKDNVPDAEQRIKIYGTNEWTAPIASGSNTTDAMVICPCSSGCIAAVAQGASNNLLERAADVMIKENKPLLLVPREMPMSAIVLENCLKLARIGVTIMPACPGFYHQPQSVAELVDFVVARILDHLGIDNDLVPRWGA